MVDTIRWTPYRIYHFIEIIYFIFPFLNSILKCQYIGDKGHTLKNWLSHAFVEMRHYPYVAREKNCDQKLFL